MGEIPLEGRESSESGAEAAVDLPFREWFDAACARRLHLTEAQVAPSREFQYLFVSGFHNEIMPLYFWGNIRELRRRGVSSKDIRRLNPSSHLKYDTVVDWFAKTLESVTSQTSKRVVIVGHSRGACTSLAAVLQNLDWFRDRVEAMFLIQGPFGGTAIADYVVAREAPFPATWPLRRLNLARSLTSLERFALRLGWDSGLHDLTHEASRHYWEEALPPSRDRSSELARELDRRVYFITASIDPSRSRFPRSELGYILQEIDGANDGVIALADQSIEGIGTVLGPLEAAHTDLVWGLYSTPAARQYRRALTQTILRVLAARHAGEIG